MAWFWLVVYSMILGAIFSRLPSYSFDWRHLFALNTLIIMAYVWVIAASEQAQVEGEPMYLIAFLVMLAVSSIVSQASYRLVKWLW
jgi:uncharacterized membrane protein